MLRSLSSLMLGASLLSLTPLLRASDDDPTIRGKSLTEWLKVLHDDPDVKKRQIAILIVDKFGTKSKLVLPALLKELRDNSEPAIRARCAALLTRYKDSK